MFDLTGVLGAAAMLGGLGSGDRDLAEPLVQTATTLQVRSSTSPGPQVFADSTPSTVQDLPGAKEMQTNAAVNTAPDFAAAAAATSRRTAAASSANRLMLPVTQDVLLQFNVDFRLSHEARPNGVPGSYDWYSRPRRGSWNTVPEGFTALTGWGQAFWSQGTTSVSAYLLLRNHMTLVCHGSARQWSLVQSSSAEGAEFRPDYAGNVASAAASPGVIEAGASAVGFAATSAYHFWPKTGRSSIPGGALCGMLVLVQARAEPIAPGSYQVPNMLLGMGADYWLSKTAPWDNYRTNRDVAIGRLRLVMPTWGWYGLSTASDSDLKQLLLKGYDDAR